MLVWTGSSYRWVAPLAADRVLTSRDGQPPRWSASAGGITVAGLTTQTPAMADDAVYVQSGSAVKAAWRVVDREIRRARPRRVVHVFEDFLVDAGVTTAGGAILETNDAGASTTTSAITETDHPGQVTSTTGISATSGASAQVAGSNQIRFGGGTWVYEAEIRIPTASDGTNTYALLVGFFDVTNVANQVDGAYLLYDSAGVSTGSAASANWQTVTTAGSSRTFNTSSTAVATGAAAWVTLRIEVNAAASSVEFFVGGVSLGTHSTNIPASSSQLTGAGWCIKKSAGTTARTVVVDYVMLDCQLTADRA